MQILGLELLRGLCALLVALYHCFMWSGVGRFHSWGLYGVYIFFGISGAVLYLNYHDRLGQELSIGSFLLKRFARLAPLYIACVVTTGLVLAGLSLDQWPVLSQAINASMLFGFLNPGLVSTVTGGWSLGIEFVFYILFPVLLAFMKNERVMWVTLIWLLALRVIYIESIFDTRTFEEAYGEYTQAGTFLVFFFGGMVAAKVIAWHRWYVVVGCAAALVMFSLPMSSADDALTGTHGVAYAVFAMAIIPCFFFSPSGQVLRSLSRFMGEISYGLYLIHPIAWVMIQKFIPMDTAAQIVVTLVVSTGFSWVALRLYERPTKAWILRYGQAPTAPRVNDGRT